jgi:AAA15 family ATPase/GTPase
MLLEFSFENYTSFKDSTTFSMVASKAFKEHSDTNTVTIDKNLKVLKSAVVYGGNGSGKSNLLDALAFMKSTVLNSFRDALVSSDERKFKLEKFLLNSESETEPSFFEVTFFHKAKKYRYGFELDTERVLSEWLFSSLKREVFLFKRSGQEIEVNQSSFSEGSSLKQNVKENVLFLTLLAQLNGSIASEVVEWFQGVGPITGIHDRGYKQYTVNKLKEDKKFHAFATKFLQSLEISDITTSVEEFNQLDIDKLKEKEKDEELINLLATVQKYAAKAPKRDKLITWHRKYDENHTLLDTVAFNFDQQESEGTKKFLYLLGPWYDSLQNGKVIIVDELDSRLHSHLTRILIDLFHSERNVRAQLIFATHDSSILQSSIFRRDQVWFVEKDQFGASRLYPLSDFSAKAVRKTSALGKNYMEGKYGAVPAPVNQSDIEESIYGHKEG